MKYGIPCRDINGIVFAWDFDFEDTIEEFELNFKKKVWPSSWRSKAKPEKVPMRFFQLNGSRWTIAYPCDGLNRHSFSYFTPDQILEFSYIGDTDMFCLELSDTAGIDRLWNCFIGQVKELWATDCRSFGDDDLFEQCTKSTLDEIENQLIQRKIDYVCMQDEAPRSKDGALPSFEDAFPEFDRVKKHALVI
jgi:hypothetical protein